MSLVRMRQKMHDKLPMFMLALALVFAVGWIGLVLGGSGAGGDKKDQSGVLAVVGKEKIDRVAFEAQVQRQLDQMGKDRQISAFEESQFRGQLLDQMVDRALRMQAAKKAGVRVSRGEIKKKINSIMDEQIKQMRTQLLAGSKDKSDKALDAILSRRGTSLDKLKQDFQANMDPEMVREQIAMEKLVQKLKDKVDTSDKAVRASYDEVKFSQITIAAKGRSMDQAEQQAKEIKSKIKNAADFAAKAKEFSEDPYKANGGARPFFSRRAYLETELADKVFDMKIGEFSDPIKLAQGYVLVKLDEKHSTLPKDYSNPKKQKEYRDAYVAQMQYTVQSQFMYEMQQNAKVDVRDAELRAYMATKEMSGQMGAGPAAAKAKALEAIKELQKAIQTNSADSQAMARVHSQLAYLYEWMRKPGMLSPSKEESKKYLAEEKKALNSALENTEANDLRTMLADINIEEGQYAKALENLRFVSDNAFDDPTTHQQLIARYKQLKKYEPAQVATLIASEQKWLDDYNKQQEDMKKSQSQMTAPIKVGPTPKEKSGG